jgi:hypothetical protein
MKKDFSDFLSKLTDGPNPLGLFGIIITAISSVFLLGIGLVNGLRPLAPWWRALDPVQKEWVLLGLVAIPPLVFLIKFLRFRKARRVERVVERMGV